MNCTGDCIHCKNLRDNYIDNLFDGINICILTGEVVLQGMYFLNGFRDELPF